MRRTVSDAYRERLELAMERLNKSAPAKKLSAAQKAEIADLPPRHLAKSPLDKT